MNKGYSKSSEIDVPQTIHSFVQSNLFKQLEQLYNYEDGDISIK